MPVAQDLVVQAALILGDDSPSVVAIREELGKRFSVEAKIERLTQGLNASLDADLLLNSSETQPSAKSFVDQLRNIDPLEPAVASGTERYVDALVFQTMIAASGREFDRADQLIAEAKQFGIKTESVNRAEQEVIRAKTLAAQDAQQLADAQKVAQEAAAAAAAEAAAREQAELLETQAQQTSETEAPADDGDVAAEDTVLDGAADVQTAEQGDAQEGGQETVQDVEEAETGVEGEAVAPAALALNAEALQSAISPQTEVSDAGSTTNQPQVVPLSALEFKRYVQPRLVPTSATRRQEDGFIDIEFSVNQDGTTTDIEVMDTTTMTQRSITRAVNAVERWRFEPIPQPVRSGVRLRYQDE